MQLKTFLCFSVLLLFFVACEQDIAEAEDITIIPIPQSMMVQDGKFKFNSETTLNTDTSFSVSSDFLRNYIKDGTGIDLKTNF